MIDIDNFKQINDQHGHQAGDAVLQEISNRLIRSLREIDVPARYGGDEFIIVLPDTSLQITCERAEQILSLTKQLQMHIEGEQVGGITASIGVSFFPDNGITKADILRTVDMALFCAKNNGRDRVILSDRQV